MQINLPPEIIDASPLQKRITEFKTGSLIKTDQIMVKRVILLADQSMPMHHAPGIATFYCIEGVIDFTVVGNDNENHTFQLKAGDLLMLDAGTDHSLIAVQNASLLVTIRL